MIYSQLGFVKIVILFSGHTRFESSKFSVGVVKVLRGPKGCCDVSRSCLDE